MLNILIYSPIAVECGRGGEISSMELASGLNEFYNVTFMHSNKYSGNSLLSNEAIKRKLKGVKINGRIKFAKLNFRGRLFSFPFPADLLKLYKRVKKADIIYTSYSSIKETLIFLFYSLVHRNGKLIIGYRKPLRINKTFSLYNLKYIFSIIILSLFKKRIFHHALSKNAKKYLDTFIKSDKVVHITHGIDLKNYIKDVKKSQEQVLNFVYIGYLDNVHKGVDVLLDGIELFIENNTDSKVFFEFSGMGPLEPRLKKLEKKHPKLFKFNGYISNELVPDYYRKGDVFLFSSRIEPFPRAIMEALAARLLILSSKTIGSIELLKNRPFAFFLNELSPKAIKTTLQEIYTLWLEQPDKFRELQNQAKEYVFNNYSFKRELAMFKQLISKIENQ